MIVALDASPVSLLTQRKGIAEADACRAWAESLVAGGTSLVLPGIADYELRRELLRAGKTAGVGRLDALRANPAVQYLPVSDAAMLRAASLGAEARRRGLPTADPAELDCDVVLVGIVLASGFPPDQVVIATTNVGHLSRFLPADNWRNIRP